MNITFDDQNPLPGEKHREAKKGFSLEKKMMAWGIAKNNKQAFRYTVILSVCIIAACGAVTFSALKKEPIDEKYYYDPSEDYDTDDFAV